MRVRGSLVSSSMSSITIACRIACSMSSSAVPCLNADGCTSTRVSYYITIASEDGPPTISRLYAERRSDFGGPIE